MSLENLFDLFETFFTGLDTAMKFMSYGMIKQNEKQEKLLLESMAEIPSATIENQ